MRALYRATERTHNASVLGERAGRAHATISAGAVVCSALACDMIGRPGWRGVAVQMTPYLLHSRTLPHLYGTATSRCPNGQLGELRRTCTWEEPSTFIRSKLQCRHNFIIKTKHHGAFGARPEASIFERSCTAAAAALVAAAAVAGSGWLGE